MVPDSDSSDSEPSQSATSSGTRGDNDASSAILGDLQERDAYDLVYHATRAALWDVLGTATLILFYLVVVGIALSVAVGGIGPFVGGSGSVTALAVGLVALAVALVAGVRVYRLVTE
jgi:hypothetical protein